MNKKFLTNKIDLETIEILLYGTIGEDIKAVDFVSQLKVLESSYKKINIRINSGGGGIFEGLAIFNAIKRSPALTTGFIDGLAASMASAFAMACNALYMNSNAQIMTHKSKGSSTGSAREMRQTADLMEKLEIEICKMYSEKTGLTPEQAALKYLTEEDRWITASEALSEKIIDGIIYNSEIEPLPESKKTEKEATAFYTSILNKVHFRQDFDFILSPEEILELGKSFEAGLSNKILVDAAKKNVHFGVNGSAEETAREDINIDVDEALRKSVVNKDITQDTADQLKQQYLNAAKGLTALLLQFAQQRIDYLMGLSWDELDKGDSLLEELKRKYLSGYEQKFYEAFGRKPTENKGKGSAPKSNESENEKDHREIRNLIAYALSNNDIDEQTAEFILACHADNRDLRQCKETIARYAAKRIDYLMSFELPELDKKGLAEELKTKFYQGYLQKFKEAYKVDYIPKK